jgi:Generalcontrol nonderepressible 1 (Gcn1) N-terminal
LAAERDQLWAINALEATAMRSLKEMEPAWPIAAIFFVANPKLSRKVRAAAMSMLQSVSVAVTPEHYEVVADVLIHGVEEWLRQVGVFLLHILIL